MSPGSPSGSTRRALRQARDRAGHGHRHEKGASAAAPCGVRVRSLFAPLFAGLLMIAVPALAKDVITPLIASPMLPTAFSVVGTDDRQHLVYELVLTNAGATPATLQKIEVVSDDVPAKVLATFAGEALIRQLRSPARVPVTSSEIDPNGTRLLLVDFTLKRDSRPPATVLHRLELLAAAPPGQPKGAVAPYTYTVAPIAVSTDIAVLGPPLAGKHWVALNGCCAPGGVHRSSGLAVNGRIHFAQRFAIDWMRLDADARFSHGDGKTVADYTCYGDKVLAVADGTVVATLADMEDQVPGELPDPKSINIDNVDGNHVVLDLGHGRYAFYAHLQKNSLRVARGERVKRGQVLALLGNTGNTSAPHLHFHLMDGPSVLGSSGLPYVFDRFEVSGRLPAAQFDASGIDGEWSKGLSAHPSGRTLEFPLDLSVIDFVE